MVVLCNQSIDLLKMVEKPRFFHFPTPQNSSNSSQFWILISDHPRMFRIQSQQLPTFQPVKNPNQWRGSHAGTSHELKTLSIWQGSYNTPLIGVI